MDIHKNDKFIIQYLDFLNGIISRMSMLSANSKILAVTYLGVIMVFHNGVLSPLLIIAKFMPLIMLYILDSFYIGTERSYRNKETDFIKKLKEDSVEKNDIYDLKSESWCKSTCKGLWSIATTPLYIILTIVFFLFHMVPPKPINQESSTNFVYIMNTNSTSIINTNFIYIINTNKKAEPSVLSVKPQ